MVTVIEDAFSREGMLNMVFTTAIEGGINYWASVNHYKWSNGAPDYEMVVEFEGVLQDYEDAKKYTVNADVIKRGIRLAHTNRLKIGDKYQRDAIIALHWGINRNHQNYRDEADFDATTADIIVQYGLFGELVYG